MRILVTGGCGFIGSHLADFYLRQGDEVRVVDDLSTGSLQNISSFCDNAKFQFNKSNILTWNDLKQSVAWADRIYHMAAVVGVYRVLNEPINVFTVNINGCEKLFEAISASGSKARVIIASSSSVYGHSTKILLSEDNDLLLKSDKNPLRNYALSKIVNEELAIAYYHSEKIPTTIVRLFNTIGPRQTGSYGMVVPRFIQQACQGRPITIYGDGTQTRSFCDVRDVITAFNLLANQPDSIGQVVNVGHDEEITINDLAKLIKQQANSASEIQYIPFIEAYGQAFSDIKQRRPDLTKLYQLTNFKYQWTLEKTIRGSVEEPTKVAVF